MKTKNLLSKLSFVALFLVATLNTFANNVEITGTAVSGTNINFNISWENSWNTNLAPSNYDAVWVFVKYQDCTTTLWNHASLSTTVADHSAASPLQVDPVTDGKGVFLRRSALGGGNIASTAISLKLNIPAGTYNYKVFAIEMVNIPQGDFQIGDGTSTGTFNSITITSASQSSGIPASTIGGASVTVPSTFPMGYNAFYSMKYEITQEQFVGFLNTLTFDQQNGIGLSPFAAVGTQIFTAGTGFRNGIEILESGNNNILPAIYACDLTDGIPNNIDDGQNIAMNNMNWTDLAAYLDWAALRPMTELEYEKICRGPEARVAGEYPWGTTDIAPYYSSSIVAASRNKPDENVGAVNNGSAIHNLVSIFGSGAIGVPSYGPARSGIFATGISGKSSSGAGYYGVMEMAGNVWERPVTVFNATGAAFTGNLGDGIITITGFANQTSWPGTDAVGSGFKGGSYIESSVSLRTSQRSGTASNARSVAYGGRGVR